MFKPCGLLGGRRELHADAKTNPKLKVKVKGSPDKHSKAGANRQRGDNKETTRRQQGDNKETTRRQQGDNKETTRRQQGDKKRR